MSEDFEAVERQFSDFVLADDAGKKARAEQLKSLIDHYRGNETGMRNLDTAMINALLGVVIASYVAGRADRGENPLVF